MALKDELKEGYYVRLNRDQGINKIIEIDEDDVGKKRYFLDGYYYDDYGEPSSYLYEYGLEDDVEEFGSDIKDVIEPGDFIDGNSVIKHPNYDGLVVLTLNENFNTVIVPLEDYDFEGRKILTLEQYRDWGYEV